GQLRAPAGAATYGVVLLDHAHHEDLAGAGDLVPDGLEDAADQGDLRQRPVQPPGGVDQAEVALLELFLAEGDDAPLALQEAVAVEGEVDLVEAPALGADAEG